MRTSCSSNTRDRTSPERSPLILASFLHVKKKNRSCLKRPSKDNIVTNIYNPNAYLQIRHRLDGRKRNRKIHCGFSRAPQKHNNEEEEEFARTHDDPEAHVLTPFCWYLKYI